MKVECKDCGHQLDPNDPDTKWDAPSNKESIGAIVCPGCDTKRDFVDWKSVTKDSAPSDDT